MPLPEGYLPRTGDVLVLHGTVVYDVEPTDAGDPEDKLRVFVRLDDHYENSRVPLSSIVALHSRNWQVGELAMYRGVPGEIIAIAEGMCWIKNTLGAYSTVPAGDLEIEPTQPKTDIV